MPEHDDNPTTPDEHDQEKSKLPTILRPGAVPGAIPDDALTPHARLVNAYDAGTRR